MYINYTSIKKNNNTKKTKNKRTKEREQQREEGGEKEDTFQRHTSTVLPMDMKSQAHLITSCIFLREKS